MMKVAWKIPKNTVPILYRNRVRQTGLSIYHWRVLPGELTEETRTTHEINIALSGSVVTRNHTTAGTSSENEHQPGSICIIPIGHSAEAMWQTEIECMRIAIDPVFVHHAMMELNLPGGVELIETYNRRDPVILHLSHALLGEAAAKETIGLIYAESLAQTLILHLVKNYSSAGSKDYLSGGLSGHRLRHAKEYINEHLEEDLTLRRMAEAVGFSQFHFAREFSRSTGLSPQQYLIQQRLTRAKELLSHGDLPLVEVATRAGFRNQSHFTTLFRKKTALTPKAFRQLKRG